MTREFLNLHPGVELVYRVKFATKLDSKQQNSRSVKNKDKKLVVKQDDNFDKNGDVAEVEEEAKVDEVEEEWEVKVLEKNEKAMKKSNKPNKSEAHRRRLG